MRSALILLVAGLFACHAPRPGIEAARTRLDDGDLLGALVQLDRVSPHQPEYAEARSLATAVERRIRTSQRLFARGLALRAQWRDEEAVRCFELAREVWPGDGAAASMIRATRHRIGILSGETAATGAGEVGDVAVTTPVEDPGEVVAAMAVDDPAEPEVVDPDASAVAFEADPLSEPVAEPDPITDPESPLEALPAPLIETVAAPVVEVPDDPSAPAVVTDTETEPAAEVEDPPVAPEGDGGDVRARAELGRAMAALQGGRLDDALRILEGLHRERSESLEVRVLLVRVLHQRALLHYGQGELARAVEVWEHVLEVDSKHGQAREFCTAAQSELDALQRRSPE